MGRKPAGEKKKFHSPCETDGTSGPWKHVFPKLPDSFPPAKRLSNWKNLIPTTDDGTASRALLQDRKIFCTIETLRTVLIMILPKVNYTAKIVISQ